MEKLVRILKSEKSNATHVQFIRYAVVAVIALSVDAGALATCKTAFNMSALDSTTIGFCLGLVVNYLLSVLWVFPTANVNKRWHELVIFGGIGLAGLIMTDLMVAVLNKHTGLAVAKASAVVVVYFWNFFARKKILYNTPLVETTL